MVRKYRKAKGMMESGVSSTYMQLRSRRIVYNRSEEQISVENGVSTSNLSSCCESNEFIDLKEDKEDDDEDTETSTFQRSTKRKLFENLRKQKKEEEEEEESMENFDLKIKESSSSDCCCSGKDLTVETTVKSTTEMTIESEIDDFFVEAEKKINDKFKKKYNFDFEKEKPLEGRYEWIKLK